MYERAGALDFGTLSVALITIKMSARSAISSAFSLLSDSAPAIAALPSSGPFLYSNPQGQVTFFVEANDKCLFLAVITHSPVKRMEAEELSLKHAEVITSVIMEIENVCYENMAQPLEEVEKIKAEIEVKDCEIKSKV